MVRFLSPFLLVAGLATCLVLGPMALAVPAAPEGLALVIAPPWGGGPASRVEAAGGQRVGPAAASWAVLATGASPSALRAAGAWLVLDPGALGALCGR